MPGFIDFLIERKSGKDGEGRVYLYPLACVIEHSAQGYWRRDSNELTEQFRRKKINFERVFGPDDQPYHKRGYHVFVDGIEFVDLTEMRDFYARNMGDPIVVEVWPDGSEQVQKDYAVKLKPWETQTPCQD